jgi:hypothetical protein
MMPWKIVKYYAKTSPDNSVAMANNKALIG